MIARALRSIWAASVATLVAAGASAQVGYVLDASSGLPIANASVEWTAEGGEVSGGAFATDVEGRFIVAERWSAGGTLSIQALGYQSLTTSVAAARESGWRLSLAPDPLGLESIVVTASGREQRLAEIAVPVAQLTEEDIRLSGHTSVDRLVLELPGVQQSPGIPTGQNVTIRGIGDARVLILVDGQPASGMLIEDRDLSRMSLAAVERVEVVKGPLSSLYGTDALGGVINIITREPDRGFNMDARVLAGGLGRQEADVTVRGGGDLRYRITGAWREQDEVPGQNDTGAFARVWDLRSTVRWGDAESSLRLRSDVIILRERQRWPTGGGFNGFNDNRGVTAWAEAVQKAFGGEVTARILGQDYSHLFRQARSNTPFAGADEGLQKERFWRGTLGYGLDVGEHRMDFGVDGLIRRIQSPDRILEDRASDRQLELYSQSQWQVGAQTTLSTGVRGVLNDRWGNAFAPSLGITSLVGGSLRLKASAGRGFRAPSFKELAWDFSNLGGGYTVQGFGDLNPESSWNLSAGVDWAPSPDLALTAEVFDNRIENLVQFALIGNSQAGLLVFSPRNVEAARTRGAELGARFDAGPLRGRAEYAYLDAFNEETGLTLDRRATHTGLVRLGTTLGIRSGLDVDVSLIYTGDSPLIGTGDDGLPAVVATQEALTSVDIQTGFRVVEGYLVTVGVQNLFNDNPAGWQGINQRRLRFGVEARDIF